MGSPLQKVVLRKITNKANPLDGYYRADANLLEIKFTSETEMDITLIVPKSKGCNGLSLSGKLLKIQDRWKGSLDDETSKGSAAIELTFIGEKINIQLMPAFLPGIGCLMEANPYMR